jgi:hypothetical protein
MRLDERANVLGRGFTLRIEGPRPSGRYQVQVWEGRRTPWKRPYLRAPILGRSPDEARDRALEVLHTYVGLERFRLMVTEVARRAAPGAGVEVGEDAREVTVTLVGPYALDVPLVVSRGEVVDRGADPERLRGLVRAHLDAYTKPVSAPPR